MKKTIIIIIGIIVISNLPFFSFFTNENYTYGNLDDSFTYDELGKGTTFNTCLIVYGKYLCEHPEKNQSNIQLYRTFTIKPWRFWEWREMIFHSDRFALPYKEPAVNK